MSSLRQAASALMGLGAAALWALVLLAVQRYAYPLDDASSATDPPLLADAPYLVAQADILTGGAKIAALPAVGIAIWLGIRIVRRDGDSTMALVLGPCCAWLGIIGSPFALIMALFGAIICLFSIGSLLP